MARAEARIGACFAGRLARIDLRQFFINSQMRATSFGMNRAMAVYQLRDWLFDVWHGVETRGTAGLKAFSVKGSHGQDATWYEAADPRLLYRALKGLEIDFARYAFIDYGSGKGRALLVASEFPFRHIIGIEFARELHEIALKNVERCRGVRRRCREIQCIHGDAADFRLPEQPLVIFMYNPFKQAVFARVLGLLNESLHTAPRDVWLIYVNALQDDLIQRQSALRKVASFPYHNVYRYSAP